jgi:hypothetical protein
MSGNIWDHFVLALQTKPLTMQIGSGEEINLLIPSMIAYLIGYVLMQVRNKMFFLLRRLK